MHSYQHKDWQGNDIELPSGKVVCVGRNYLDHIKELENDIPEDALLFMKPATALADVKNDVVIPETKGSCHNELEIAVLINKRLTDVMPAQAAEGIWGYGLGLDLTLRDLQDKLKSNGLPWEKAKAFDGSCPLSGFVPAMLIPEPEYLKFQLNVNGKVRQVGEARMMMREVNQLISEISHHFSLMPGDIVLTGTPKGVGVLTQGDQLSLSMGTFLSIETQVIF